MRWDQIPVMMRVAAMWKRAREESKELLLTETCSRMTTTATTRTKSLVPSSLKGGSANELQAVKSESVSSIVILLQLHFTQNQIN